MPEKAMKVSRGFLLIAGTALFVLAGMGIRKVVLAQSSQTPQWMLDEAKLAPDIHPDTLSRMPRPKESDYATQEEKDLFNKVMHRNPTQFTKKFLGPTGTRVAIPELAGGGDGLGNGKPALDPKYRELIVEVAAREADNRNEFLGHEVDGVNAYGMAIEMAVIDRWSTEGMEPKAAAIIEYARDLFRYPRIAPVSSKVYADLEKNFSRREILQIVGVAEMYDSGGLEMRAYDQRQNTDPGCAPAQDGCLDLVHPPLAWEFPTSYKPVKEPSMNEWMAEQGKLPPDVHPDTLSRMPRPQASDYTDEKERDAFNKIMSNDPRWLGPTGTLVAVPGMAQANLRTVEVIHTKSGVDDKYLQLTAAVSNREIGDRQDFIMQEDDAVKAYGKDLEEVVRLRKSTQGLDDPKAVAIIEFARDMFKWPRTLPVTSEHYAALDKAFGKRGALAIIMYMCYLDNNSLLMRTFDQHMDTKPDCSGGVHAGCLDTKPPPPAW